MTHDDDVVVLEPDDILPPGWSPPEPEPEPEPPAPTRSSRPCVRCGGPVELGADAALIDALNLGSLALRFLGLPTTRIPLLCRRCRP